MPAWIPRPCPTPARIWDYWLKGTDNYAVDRELGDRIEEMLPDIVRQAREDRLFLGRVVRYLAGGPGSGSSWISGPACRRRTIPIRSPSPSPRSRGSSTSTTIPWSWRMRGPC